MPVLVCFNLHWWSKGPRQSEETNQCTFMEKICDLQIQVLLKPNELLDWSLHTCKCHKHTLILFVIFITTVPGQTKTLCFRLAHPSHLHEPDAAQQHNIWTWCRFTVPDVEWWHIPSIWMLQCKATPGSVLCTATRTEPNWFLELFKPKPWPN